MPDVINFTDIEKGFVISAQTVEKKIKELEERINILELKLGIKTTNNKIDCLYFANGVRGAFLKTKGSPALLDNSLFCFEKISENEAYVSVVDQLNVVKKFQSNPDTLEGVCEQLNQCKENTIGIETIEKGKAIVEDNVWKITTVAKISYKYKD